MPVNIYFCKGLKSGVCLNSVLIRNLFECDVYVRRKNSIGVWVKIKNFCSSLFVETAFLWLEVRCNSLIGYSLCLGIRVKIVFPTFSTPEVLVAYKINQFLDPICQ